MKKALLSLIVILGFANGAYAITCPAGEHSQCHGGSGRGGGYKTTCACIADSCSFYYGTYPVGSVVTSYTQYQATIPDDCSNYTVQSTCIANNNWSPAPRGAFCTNVAPGGGDDS